MKEDVRLYRGLFKVRVLNKLDGTWEVEALESYSNIRKGERFMTHKINLENIVKEA